MPSAVRNEWERLVAKCEEVGLPAPVMSPMGLGDKVAINIRHDNDDFGFRTAADTMAEAISNAIIYIWGYRNALRDAKATLVQSRPAEVPERDTPAGMRHQAWLLCCGVLNSGTTYQGRAELTDIARAVLATNTASALESYHANQKNRP